MLQRLGQALYQRVIVSYRSTLIGIACAAAIVLIDSFTDYLQGLPKGSGTVLAGLAVTLGALLKAKLSEQVLPSAPPAALKTLLVIAVGSALLLAAPARASSPLVVCISGCPGEARRALPMALGGADVQLGPTIWFGPSVGAAFVRDGATKSWEGSVQPALSYGLKYKPAWWTATASLLALDLSISSKFSSTFTPQSIDLLPMLTVGNTIGVGVGPRFHLASTAGERDAVSFILGLSINTALGAP